MRIFLKVLWLTHPPRLLKIGVPGATLCLTKIRKISLMMWAILLISLPTVFYLSAYFGRHLNALVLTCIDLTIWTILFLIAFHANGFYFGSLFFKVNGQHLEVHDWKLQTGKQSVALEKDFIECFAKIATSGATSIKVKSHIFGKWNQQQLKCWLVRRLDLLGIQDLKFEILPQTRTRILDRMLMAMMRIPQRSQYESGFRIILTPALANVNGKL